jgi:hypothetical protein
MLVVSFVNVAVKPRVCPWSIAICVAGEIETEMGGATVLLLPQAHKNATDAKINPSRFMF